MNNRFSIFVLALFVLMASAHAVHQEEYLNWQYETGSGSIVFDSTGNDNNGVLQGGSWDTTPVRWGSYSIGLDGTNDYVSGITTIENTSKITLSMWFYSDDNGDWHIIELDGQNEMLELQYDNGNNTLNLGYINSSLNYTHQNIDTFDFVQGQWYHIAFSLDASNNTFTYWRNGAKIRDKVSIIEGYNQDIEPKTIRVGTNHEANNFFRGNIDSTRIFDGSLNDSQINSLYINNNVVLQTNGVEEDKDLIVTYDELILDYSPKQGSNLTNPINFNIQTYYKSNCELYIDNELEKEFDSAYSSNYDTKLSIGEHRYFFACEYENNGTDYIEVTNTTYFNVTEKPPSEILFQVTGKDFNVDDVDLWLVSPCMEKGYSAIGTEYKPYRSKYNTGGINFDRFENGFASLIVSGEQNEFCLFNGRVIVNEEGRTTDYDIVTAYNQIELGEIKTPSNTSDNMYSITLEQFDIYQKVNPKAWGQTWGSIISGLILLVIGVAIVIVGANLGNGKIVMGGVIMCLSAMGISFTGFVGVLA